MRYYKVKTQTTYENIWRFVQWHWLQHGCGPSVRDVADAIGVSSSDTAQGYIDRMVFEGLLKRIPSKARTLQVVDGTMPQHCLHDWRVLKVDGEIFTVLCLLCDMKTEKEYKPDLKNPKTLLRYYE